MITELSKRRVFRVISGYAVVCFVILQIADVAFEPLGISNDVLRIIIAGMLLALPLVGYLSWIFDVGAGSAPTRTVGGRPWLEALIALAALLVFAIGAWLVVQSPAQTRADAGSMPFNTSDEPAISADADSIAVLPFANLSSDPNQVFFSDGISEDILNELSNSHKLTVRPRSSSFRFRGKDIDSQEIGRQLKVSHVLEGSVRRADGRIRVNVQLVDVKQNRPLWSQRYERDLQDVFEMQDEISSAILSALGMQFDLGPRRTYVGQSAYDAFLKGRNFLLATGGSDQAKYWLKEATRLNPQNIEAWYLLAKQTWLDIYNTPQATQLRPQLESYLEAMETIDPDYPGFLSTNAVISISERRDFQSSIVTLVGLVTENPNNLDLYRDLANGLARIRRFDLSTQVYKEIVKRDPQSRISWAFYITSLLTIGELESALNVLPNLEDLGAPARFTQIEVALSIGDLVTLAEEIELGRATIGSNSFYIRREALMHAVQGDVSTASALLTKLQDTPSPVSADYGGLSYSDRQEAALIEGRTVDAFRHFEKAMAAYEQQAISGTYGGYFAFRKYFPAYYNSPEYLEILSRYGVDDASLAQIHVPELPF